MTVRSSKYINGDVATTPTGAVVAVLGADYDTLGSYVEAVYTSGPLEGQMLTIRPKFLSGPAFDEARKARRVLREMAGESAAQES